MTHLQKYLRQWIYRQHYHPDVGPDEEPHWLLHTGETAALVLPNAAYSEQIIA